MTQPLRVAIVGAGPAGIYAADLLIKSAADVSIDLFEQMPAPFGLIRYGVAPDHPRIKGIVKSLHNVLDKPEVRLLANITIGRDITVDELRSHYDAVVFSTGAVGDRDLGIPGADLEGSFGAGEFVGFYDGNPRFARSWDLSAQSVAVVGVGNVGLDVARILAKTGDELLVTEIPDNVYQSLKNNKATDVHVFGRRGPAHVKFTPQELKELDHSPTINVVVDPNDIDYDAASEEARRSSKSQDLVCSILENYAIRDPKDAPTPSTFTSLKTPWKFSAAMGMWWVYEPNAPNSTAKAAYEEQENSLTGLFKPSIEPLDTAPMPSPDCPLMRTPLLSPMTAGM